MDRSRRATATAAHGRCLWLGGHCNLPLEASERRPKNNRTGVVVGTGGHRLPCQQPDVDYRDRHSTREALAQTEAGSNKELVPSHGSRI